MSGPDAFANLPATPRMPALFVGHGTPMNAIKDNRFSRTWREIGRTLPRPHAILCVSAHWVTRGTALVHVGQQPKTIHDFGGFPAELYAQQYPAPGAPEAAKAVIDLVQSVPVQADTEWGLDHGAWSVLVHWFPAADIPTFQLSLDLSRSPAEHFDLARELKPLRDKGVLIVGSGNIVHNLRAMWPDTPPYSWAEAFDADLTTKLEAGDFRAAADYQALGEIARLSHPTVEHYLPVLYPLGAADEKDRLEFFNVGFDLASLSMRSFILR
ncbi:MAG TPA: 4,5-DOPA dioxygenase extradiol [Candidatus Competibacter sp.]|nr:4,5-DOPA dioxygenase extradiol [Candidatus Competibacteraceae bacterium]HRC73851.1 4,5-DOPA dioxygenase extradiol [Candidatus Competibacter sp.]